MEGNPDSVFSVHELAPCLIVHARINQLPDRISTTSSNFIWRKRGLFPPTPSHGILTTNIDGLYAVESPCILVSEQDIGLPSSNASGISNPARPLSKGCYGFFNREDGISSITCRYRPISWSTECYSHFLKSMRGRESPFIREHQVAIPMGL